jgi:hypothetical protein
MMNFRPLRSIVFSGLGFAVLSACGGQAVPTSPLSSSGESRSTHTTPVYGVGLSGALALGTPGYSREDTWVQPYCQQPGYTFENCQVVKPGKLSSRYSTSHQLSDFGGSTSLTVTNTSVLGKATFSQSETAVSSPYSSGKLGLVTASDNSGWGWQDQLTPESPSLPKGTAVAFKVTLSITPSTTLQPCAYWGQGNSVEFAASGTDKYKYTRVRVFGSCHGTTVYTPGTFEYTKGSQYGPQGTKDVGTLSGYVDEPVTIFGDGSVFTSASDHCRPPEYKYQYCLGSFSDALAGTVKYTIKPITPGVTFTTASGKTY